MIQITKVNTHTKDGEPISRSPARCAKHADYGVVLSDERLGSAARHQEHEPFRDGGGLRCEGCPGAHNASAVISVDADYTKYRTSSITVDNNVWSVGQYQFPIGLLTDSEEPDNAKERYDRAIEKSVGYISLFPENCTGHIREPTRSIGEIRTLVAPKSRLDTLTYVDEMGGWRVPQDASDEKAEERPILVSDFPDVAISVMPRSRHANATQNPEVSPSSLYIDFESALNLRYRIDPLQAQDGTIGWKAREYRVWRTQVGKQTALQTHE